MPEATKRRFCLAPMLDWTDRHCRFFHRLLSRQARLYSEMLTAAAVLHGDLQRLLAFSPAEHPVALQLGGCDPTALAEGPRSARPTATTRSTSMSVALAAACRRAGSVPA